MLKKAVKILGNLISFSESEFFSTSSSKDTYSVYRQTVELSPSFSKLTFSIQISTMRKKGGGGEGISTYIKIYGVNIDEVFNLTLE